MHLFNYPVFHKSLPSKGEAESEGLPSERHEGKLVSP